MAEAIGDSDEKEKQKFAKRLLVALNEGTFVRSPTAEEDINNFAEIVKKRLDEVSIILDERGLKFSEESTRAIEQMIEMLKHYMKQRQSARIGAFSGNILRIGGILKYAHPFGQAAFWIGLTMSSIGDIFATSKSGEIENLANTIHSIFTKNQKAFEDVAKAILRLEKAIEKHTGWTLYDEQFRNFLRIAATEPEAVKTEIIPHVENNPELQRNIMDLAQNRVVIHLLTNVLEAIEREDTIVLHIISQGFGAISFIQETAEECAAFQACEVAVRGLVLLLEYKQNKRTLDGFLKEVQRIKVQYQCLNKIYGPEEEETP